MWLKPDVGSKSHEDFSELLFTGEKCHVLILATWKLIEDVWNILRILSTAYKLFTETKGADSAINLFRV